MVLGVVVAACVFNALWVWAVRAWLGPARVRWVWLAVLFSAVQCVLVWRTLATGAGETAAGWMVGVGVAALVWSFVLVPLALVGWLVGSVVAWHMRLRRG